MDNRARQAKPISRPSVTPKSSIVPCARRACALLVLCTVAAQAEAQAIDGERIRRYANGLLSLMTYTVIPDVTTSSLSLQDPTTSNPHLAMSQLGGGFVVDPKRRLYLEGNAAYTRFDPEFVVSDGLQQSEVAVRWSSVTVTGGVGWDFPVDSKWSLRPIVNFSLADMSSDLKLGRERVALASSPELDFLDEGRMKMYGLGGSLMAVYGYDKPDRELDFEARYTNVRLRTYDTNEFVRGATTAQSLSLWGRMRKPSGWVAMQRPVRYVFEAAHSQYFDSGVEALGFQRLTSLGVGLELDSSAHDTWATRWRVMARHLTGANFSGWSLGLALGF